MEQLTIIGKSILRIGESLSSLITPLINGITQSPQHTSNKAKALRISNKLKHGVHKRVRTHLNKTKKHPSKQHNKAAKHPNNHTRKTDKSKLKHQTHKKK